MYILQEFNLKLIKILNQTGFLNFRGVLVLVIF